MTQPQDTAAIPAKPITGHGAAMPPLGPDADDEALMLRIGQGDHAAFRYFTDRHLSRILALARRQLNNLAEAEEVTQDAFARLWTYAPNWRAGAAKPTTWLYRVTVNLCIDRQRRRRSAPLEAAPEPLDQSPDGFDQLHGRQVAGAVRGAVDQLPDQQRRAMLLCSFDGLSNAEAAAVLGVSVKAVESLLVRARRSLRQSLAGLYQDLSA